MPVKLRRGLLEYDVFVSGEASLFDHGPDIGDLDDPWLALDFAQGFAREPANLMVLRALLRDAAGVVKISNEELVRTFALLLAQNRLLLQPSGQVSKTLMNRISTHAVRLDAGEPEAFRNEVQETVVEEEKCKISKVVVSCAHNNNRKFKLEYPGPNRVIQVIAGAAGGRNALMQIDVDANCGHGAKDCPQVHVRGHAFDEKIDPGKKVELFGKGAKAHKTGDKSLSLNWFAGEGLWPSNVDPVTYQFSTIGCYDQHPKYSGRIECFTNVEWNGKLTMGFTSEKVTDADDHPRKDYNDAWTFDLAITYKVDKEELKIKPWKFDSHSAGPVGQLVHSTFKMMESAGPLASVESWFRKLGSGAFSGILANTRVDILWPALALEGWFKNVEHGDAYMVETEADINLALDPIIGVTIKCDILDWVITIACSAFGAPNLADVLLRIKNLAAKGVENKSGSLKAKFVIALEFEVQGKIYGKLEFKKTPSTWTFQGELGGMVGIKLTGKIEGEGKAFDIAYAKAGGKVGMKGAAIGDTVYGDFFGFKAAIQPRLTDGEPDFIGLLGCSGIKLYYALFLEVGISSGDSTKPNKVAAVKEPGVWAWVKTKASNAREALAESMSYKYESGSELLIMKERTKEFGKNAA